MTAGPVKRSSVHHLHEEAHAKFVAQHGWEIAASFGDPGGERNATTAGCAIADVSWLGKLECKGAWAGKLGSLRIPGAVACPITPSRLIWVVDPAAFDQAADTLEKTRAGQPGSYLLDVTSIYASFELVGPLTADMLSKLTSAWPEIGSPVFSPIAGVRCLLIRTEAKLQMHFSREYGEHMWETLLDAGREFKMRPVGVESLAYATT